MYILNIWGHGKNNDNKMETHQRYSNDQKKKTRYNIESTLKGTK